MKVHAIYFSPTGSTEKITKIIANEFGNYQEIDLSKHDNYTSEPFASDDICVIGVPSYGGRVPSIALDRMKEFDGNNAKAILVISYGNRAYDDTIKELLDFVNKKGFSCVAAIAAVAEHSIMHKFAKGRPDVSGQNELIEFAQEILRKINSDSEFEELHVPGNFPYLNYNGVPLKPKANGKCSGCGICANSCPVEAISLDNPKKTDKNLCISCMRCINICPNNARKLNPLMLKIASKKLEAACSDRKINELFI